MPKAYSYVRFSTLEQRKGGSENRQVQLSRDFIREHPELELDESLRFSDLGVSAYNKSNLAKGAALRKFLDAIERGIVQPGSYLLVESLDRISRAQVMDAFQLFTQILERDITIVTLADRMVYSKEKANRQFTDLMMSLVILSRAHEESLTKSKRIGAAWERKRNNIQHQKLTKTCPSWLKLSADRKIYEPIKEKVAIVRKAVTLLLSGVGKDAIAKRFNEQGIASISEKNDRQTWYGSYVTKILRNRALIGEYQQHKMINGKRVPEGEPITNYFPRILTDEKFALVQHVIDQRGKKSGGRRGKTFSNLFTGLVRCGYCDSTMVYINKGRPNQASKTPPSNIFLVCHRAKRGVGCHHIPWKYQEIEDGVLNYARGLNFEGFIKTGKDRVESTQGLRDEVILQEAKLREITSRQNYLTDSLEKAQTSSAMTPDVVLKRIVKNEQEIEAIQKALSDLKLKIKAADGYAHVTAESVEAVKQLSLELQNKSGEELYLLRARLNEHLRHLLSNIRLFPGGIFHTKEEAESIRKDLIENRGYTAEDVDKELQNIAPTKGMKEGRFLLLRRRAGTFQEAIQMLRPHEEIPDVFAAMQETPALVKQWVSNRKDRT